MAEPITQVLGIVGIKNRGEYNPETTYEKLNTVRYQGQTYCAKTDTVGNLPTNTDYWDLMVEKGEKGDTPVKGVDYYTSEDKEELITELEGTLNTDVTSEVTEQLGDLTSATPTVVSSTSAMTDTSKIYVLSTDGHWYWNNGTNWVDGGVYQATAIADNSIEYPMFKSEAKDNFKALIDNEKIDLISTARFERGSIANGANSASSSKIRSDYIDVSNITEIVCTPNSGYKFLAFFYTDKNESSFIGSTYGGYFTKFNGAYQTTKQSIHVFPQFKYIRFVIGNAINDATVVNLNEATNVKALASYQLYNNKEDYDKEYQPFFEWLDGKNYVLNYDTWENGIPNNNYTNMTINNSLSRICTGLIDVSKMKGNLILEAEEGYQCAYYFYDSSCEKIAYVFWNPSYNVPIPENAKYLIVGLSKTSAENVSSSDYINITISLENTHYVQKIEDINNIDVNIEWKIGTLVPATGKEDNTGSTANKRIRSNYIGAGAGTKLIISDTNYEHLFYKYDFDKNYISSTEWTQENIVIDEDCLIRILIRKHGSAIISDDEKEIISAKEKILRIIPQSTFEGIYNKEEPEPEPVIDIPTYFETNLLEAIDSAKINSFDTGINGDNFVFLTDVHWQSNAKNSPSLIKKVVENMNVDKIICGGDLIGGGAKASMIDLMSDCVNSYKDITRFYTVLGNHDTNHIGATSSSDYFTNAEAYTLMQKQEDFNMKYGNPGYYYFDNQTTKTRYICLDTGLEGTTLDSTQSAWITDTLASMPDGYHALVFAHIIYQPTTSWHVGLTPEELQRTAFMNSVCTILDTFNSNNTNKKVEAIFGGHVHIDCEFSSEGGIPIVLTDCDTRQTFTETTPGSGVRNQELGTINEQCFDITTIDYQNRVIKCVRVGRGSNRTIDY